MYARNRNITTYLISFMAAQALKRIKKLKKRAETA
jgi:hypothetical protein